MSYAVLVRQLEKELYFGDFLENYAEAATIGGSTSKFFSEALFSFVRGTSTCLDDFFRLDHSNRALFFRLLNVHWTDDWTQEGLNWLLDAVSSAQVSDQVGGFYETS